MAARSDFTVADCIDIQFACKEVCRRMSAPCESEDDEKRGSLCEVASACFGAVQVPGTAAQYGCNRGHGLRRMQKNQKVREWRLRDARNSPHQELGHTVIAMSSGEAEYCGVVNGACEAVGFLSLLQDLTSRRSNVRVSTDSSRGIAVRQGVGKVRHLEVRTLWLQDQVDRGLIQVAKIVGQTIACTKYFDGRTLQEMLSLLPLCFTGGRHALGPQLHGQIQVLMSDECSKSQ